MKRKATCTVIIDRVEGDLAVVVLCDDDSVKFNLPLKYLPKDVRGGDHLQVSFAVDEGSREAEKKRIEDLYKQLMTKETDQQ
jgi:hypothetical protein